MSRLVYIINSNGYYQVTDLAGNGLYFGFLTYDDAKAYAKAKGCIPIPDPDQLPEPEPEPELPKFIPDSTLTIKAEYQLKYYDQAINILCNGKYVGAWQPLTGFSCKLPTDIAITLGNACVELWYFKRD